MCQVIVVKGEDGSERLKTCFPFPADAICCGGAGETVKRGIRV